VTIVDARLHGLDRWNLQRSGFRRVGPGTYLAASVEETALLKIQAASLRMPPKAAFAGFTAAYLLGLSVDPCDPIEIVVPPPFGISTRSGMRVRRCVLNGEDLVKAKGYRATSPLRTVLDVSGCLSLTESVVFADMAMHAKLFSMRELESAASDVGNRGVRRLRELVRHVEPLAASPMETRLRMLPVLAGLPRPVAQFVIRNRWLRFAGRVDLYYPDEKVALEYDGATHKDSIAEDNRRQNRLVEAGVKVLRFTSGDIFDTPELVVSAIRAALGR
jgi:hypothetical protein